jgi:hypothetical protein
MHFPEFALVPRRERSLCGDMGEITVFIGIVLDNQPDLSPVGVQDLLDGRTDPNAVRSLVVEKLDNCNRGIGGPENRGIFNGDVISPLLRIGSRQEKKRYK